MVILILLGLQSPLLQNLSRSAVFDRYAQRRDSGGRVYSKNGRLLSGSKKSRRSKTDSDAFNTTKRLYVSHWRWFEEVVTEAGREI